MPSGYDSRPPDAPARLGRYVTIRRLGAGGMAEVFLARSRGAEGTDKLLVVKRILPAFASNARFRSMFIDEARVALRLNHPNVVQVYGFESDGPSLLLVMEYVDGPDLSAFAQAVHARGEQIPAGLAAWIVREVARGLHYAHERRDDDGTPLDIVHRDVSPGNILLAHDGVVKLGDFGIAKARLVSGEEEGAIKGKFTYMSPEQARTEPVDRRADLYSLGVVLGELLAGRPLFDDVSVGAELLPRLRRGEVPDVRRVLTSAPPELVSIAARLLAPDRKARFPDAREVATALTRYLRSSGEEWDGAALAEHMARYLPRTPSLLPPDPEDPRKRHEAPTVARGRAAPARDEPVTSAGAVASRPPPATLETSSLMRERVHVAVVVGRVVALASTAETIDTRPLFDLIESLAFKAGATLERNEDGRFTLVIGVLEAHVDHALRAARLAIDIADAVSALGNDAIDAPLGIALGLARGLAAAARGTSGSLLGFEIVDDAIPFATALADLARSGEILLTPGLYRLVRRAFVLTENASRTGAGSRVFRLERPKSRAEREQDVAANETGLVGRDVELAHLEETLRRVRTTRAAESLLVVGELGIGKSAMLAAFAARHEHDGTVIRVPVPFGGGDASYRSIAQIFAEVLGVPEDRMNDSAVVDAAIDRAVEIAGIPSAPGRRAARRAMRVAFGLDRDDAGNEDATSREVLLVLRRLLTARAVMHAITLVLDGVELADRHSRAVLKELLRRPPHGAVLVVYAVRDTDEFARESIHTPILPVAPLAENARGALVARQLGADVVGDDLLREVSAVAGGNPLMILEVIEALGDRGRIEVQGEDSGARVVLSAAREGELPLPATLEEVLAARIDTLPPEARSLARWCALIEQEMPVELLEALAGNDAPRAIGRLISDGILVRVRGRRDTLAFAHSALAKVARASIDPTQIAAMHARIAATLERRPASRGAGAGAIARHREAAGAIRPAARAYLECANAHRLGSQHREALELYARVLELTSDSVDPEGYALRFAAHLGREEIYRGLARARVRRTEILAMRAIAVDAKDPRLVARALARQARYKLEIGMGTGIERDVAAATRAARRAGELRTEAEAKRVLALYLGQRGRYAEALHAAEEALRALDSRSALAPPPGGTADDGVRAARTARIEVLLSRGALLRQTGEIQQALEVYAEAYALLVRFGPRRLLAHVLNNLGVACSSRGDYEDALRLYLASIAVHRENGQRDRLGMALSNTGQTYATLGQNERALQFLKKAVEVLDALGSHSSGSCDAHVALAEMYAERGETEHALAEIERARVTTEASGNRLDTVRLKNGEAVVALARNEHRAARTSAEEAERIATEAGLVVYALHARAHAAEAAALGGDRAAARVFVDAVLSDPLLVDPLRLERGELVLASCERTLRLLGDGARADTVAALRHRRSAPSRTAPEANA
jgi:serine/threonine protein kinase/predicted ATPase